jgi:hypothetical protein
MAADKGYPPAQNNLGAKYAAGDGVPKDIVEAHVWFNLAGVKGNAAAARNLSMIEKEMSGEQRSLAMDTARKRFSGQPKSAAEAEKSGAKSAASTSAGSAQADSKKPAPAPDSSSAKGQP